MWNPYIKTLTIICCFSSDYKLYKVNQTTLFVLFFFLKYIFLLLYTLEYCCCLNEMRTKTEVGFSVVSRFWNRQNKRRKSTGKQSIAFTYLCLGADYVKIFLLIRLLCLDTLQVCTQQQNVPCEILQNWLYFM